MMTPIDWGKSGHASASGLRPRMRVMVSLQSHRSSCDNQPAQPVVGYKLQWATINRDGLPVTADQAGSGLRASTGRGEM